MSNESRGDDYVQFGGTMDLVPLSDEVEEEVVERMRDAGIDVGNAPGDGHYIVNISEERL